MLRQLARLKSGQGLGKDGQSGELHTLMQNRLPDVPPPVAEVLFDSFTAASQRGTFRSRSANVRRLLSTSARERGRRIFASLLPHPTLAGSEALGSQAACPHPIWAQPQVMRPRTEPHHRGVGICTIEASLTGDYKQDRAHSLPQCTQAT